MPLARKKNELPFLPISRETVQDHVYGRLKELILNGEIEPGGTVTIQSLADSFGVSAMPVREALHRLVAERALTIVAGRSAGIPPLTTERLEDLQRVRIEIEGAAAEWAAQTISSGDIDELSLLIEQMDAAERKNDRRKYVRANQAFHFIIYRASQSETLISIVESLWLQIGPYVNLLNASDNWWTSNEKHKQIRDALVRKDGTAARQALRTDVEAAGTALKCVLVAKAQAVKKPVRRRAR